MVDFRNSAFSILVLAFMLGILGIGVKDTPAQEETSGNTDTPNAEAQSEEVSEEEVEGISVASQNAMKDAAARGREVYKANCLACHGMAGDGKGPAAQYLNPPPRDFTGAIYKFRSTKGGELATDEDLIYIVNEGVVRSDMPPYKDLLSKQQVNDVVQYIKSLSEYYEDPAPEPIPIPEMGELDLKRVESGKYLYINLDCWTCHGTTGRADGPSSGTLKDQQERPIKAMNLANGDFKRGDSFEGIYKSIMTGLDGTPMPAHIDALLFPAATTLANEEALKGNFTDIEINQLKEFLSAQPTEQELQNMSEADKTKLVQDRAVSLVHFVKSLEQKRGLLYKLFGQDTEYTK